MRRGKRSRSGWRMGLRWLAFGIAILCADRVRSEDLAANEGQSRPRLLRAASQIGVRSDYSEVRGHGARHEALVLETQVSLASSERSFSTGFMIEGRAGDDGRHTLIAAGMFSYTRAPWTMTASPFFQRTVQTAGGHWLYWGNVRRELTPRHSLGLEVYGSIETHKPSKWLLAYSESVSKPLTVSVAIGSGVDSPPDLVIRTTVMWRLGASRR
jgi:hypothetical protein